MKNQLEIGLQVAEKFMEKRCLMLCTSGEKSQGTTSLIRKIISEASSKWDGVDLAKMHHLAFFDFSKHGRLTVPDIDQAAKSIIQVLRMNEDYSNLTLNVYYINLLWPSSFEWMFWCSVIQGMALVICPILAGEGMLGGLRGEYRRIEDKFISMGMELKNVQVAFDLTDTHGNRTLMFLILF